jgi:hypothetical protein
MKIYKLVTDSFGFQSIERVQDSVVSYIPLDPSNSDYAEYLRYTAWVEAGNDPDEFWTTEGRV